MKIRTKMRSRGLTLGLCFLMVSGLDGLLVARATAPLAAQDRAPVNRTVEGKVQEKGGAGIKGAVVYLKDIRTSQVKSAISDESGTYRFVQLSLSTDYEVWAQIDEKKSKTKSISSFDSKSRLYLDLVIDK